MMCRSLFSILVCFFCSIGSAQSVRPDARDVRVLNTSGVKVEIYWINRWNNDERVINGEGVFNGGESKINSYVGHEFEILEVASKKTGLCRGENNQCRTATFQVNDHNNQVVKVLEGFQLELEDDKLIARAAASKMVQECKAQLDDESTATKDGVELLDAMTACMNQHVNASLSEKTEEIEFQSNLRVAMGTKLEDYACLDDKMETSESSENKTWSYPGFRGIQVRVLMDRPASHIHYLERFITPDECAAIEEAIQVERVDATANGLLSGLKGGVPIPWSDTNHVVTGLAQRMYQYAEQVLKVGLAKESAEDLFAIHYESSKDNPDKYKAHCDAVCDGSPYKPGGRVATMILYCAVPESGGATHFPNAGVHVKPTTGSALFFTYYDPSGLNTDTGFTKHAGCQVREGTKKILTHKFRMG